MEGKHGQPLFYGRFGSFLMLKVYGHGGTDRDCHPLLVDE